MDLSDYVSVDQLQGFVRHAMTTLGGVGLISGNFSPDQWQAVVGAVAVVVGVVWSYVSKKVKTGGTDATPPTATAPVTQ